MIMIRIIIINVSILLHTYDVIVWDVFLMNDDFPTCVVVIIIDINDAFNRYYDTISISHLCSIIYYSVNDIPIHSTVHLFKIN